MTSGQKNQQSDWSRIFQSASLSTEPSYSSFHHDYFPVLAEVAPYLALAVMKRPYSHIGTSSPLPSARGVHCEQDLTKAVLMKLNAMSIDDPTWGTAQVVLRLA